MSVGILALQGDFQEHEAVLRKLGTEPVLVRLPEDLERIDRLIIPGGESTAIGKLLVTYKLLAPLRARIKKSMPVWGTCAGAILLAKKVVGGIHAQPSLNVMDITVERNAFGRHLDSFEVNISIPRIGKQTIPVVFIRAPIITSVGAGVEILAKLPNGSIIATQEKKMLATAFHPEITGTPLVHKYFLSL